MSPKAKFTASPFPYSSLQAWQQLLPSLPLLSGLCSPRLLHSESQPQRTHLHPLKHNRFFVTSLVQLHRRNARRIQRRPQQHFVIFCQYNSAPRRVRRLWRQQLHVCGLRWCPQQVIQPPFSSLVFFQIFKPHSPRISNLNSLQMPLALLVSTPLFSGKTIDACGVCGGRNSSCTGCDGVIHRSAFTVISGLEVFSRVLY